MQRNIKTALIAVTILVTLFTNVACISSADHTVPSSTIAPQSSEPALLKTTSFTPFDMSSKGYLATKDLQAKYDIVIKDIASTLEQKLMDTWKVYLDASENPFIISGYTKIMLEVNDGSVSIPETAIADLRTEKDGIRVKVYTTQAELDESNSIATVNSLINGEQANVTQAVSDKYNYIGVSELSAKLGLKVTESADAIALEMKYADDTTLQANVEFADQAGVPVVCDSSNDSDYIYCAAFKQNDEIMLDVDLLRYELGIDIKYNDPAVDNVSYEIVSDKCDVALKGVSKALKLPKKEAPPTHISTPDEIQKANPETGTIQNSKKPLHGDQVGKTGDGDIYDSMSGLYPKIGQRWINDSTGSECEWEYDDFMEEYCWVIKKQGGLVHNGEVGSSKEDWAGVDFGW